MNKSEESVNLALVFHFHQPIGNFDNVIENAYQKSYLPLIKMLQKYSIKSGLHYTGYLLEWLDKNHPEYFEILKDMSEKGQVEFLGGGFYEPIIAVIPDEDKKAQIKLLRDYVKKKFDLNVNGFWLAERVWEPHLPKILHECDIDYILIDDFHLKANGLYEEETFFPYYTEEQGNLVKVIPINEPLRYMIPWKQPWEPIEYLKKYINTGGDRLITSIDDAEKLGLWPAGDMTTYDICYVHGYNGRPWLDEFFSALTEADWLNIITISEYLKKFRPKGLIYMPTASYDKMSYWVLPTKARRSLESLVKRARNNELPDSNALLQFLKGGYWRGFFVKYPESNQMHKKMLHVREKLLKYEQEFGKSEELAAIWMNIYKSQTNDPYWHGQFGGIYFPFFRETIYSFLISAEKQIENLLKQKNLFKEKIYEKDLIFDGMPEILMENEFLNVYIQPHYGGSILEIDDKNHQTNILNVFTRKEEAYHDPTKNFPIDRWKKQAFLDHFIQEGFPGDLIRTQLDSFSEDSILGKIIEDKFEELGNFVDANFDFKMSFKKDNSTIELFKKGKITGNDVEINKKINLKNQVIELIYRIINKSEIDLVTYHYTEFPVLADSDLSSTKFLSNNNEFNINDICNWSSNKITIRSERKNIYITLSTQNETNFLIYPLKTYVSTDGGYDSLYQGTVIGMQHKIDLKPNEIYENSFKIEFREG